MATKPKTQPRSKLVIILAIATAALAVGLVITIAFTSFLFTRVEKHDNQRIAGMILDAVENLSRPLPTERSGQHFIPEAKLAFPAADETLGGVVYNYSAATDDMPAILHLASNNSIRMAASQLRNAEQGTMDDVFDSVPKLQQCARGVRVVFGPEPNQTYQATKKLANGTTAYFSMEEGCANDKLFAFAQQLESY